MTTVRLISGIYFTLFARKSFLSNMCDILRHSSSKNSAILIRDAKKKKKILHTLSVFWVIRKVLLIVNVVYKPTWPIYGSDEMYSYRFKVWYSLHHLCYSSTIPTLINPTIQNTCFLMNPPLINPPPPPRTHTHTHTHNYQPLNTPTLYKSNPSLSLSLPLSLSLSLSLSRSLFPVLILFYERESI